MSQEHKIRRNIEHSELSDNTLYKRARNKPTSIEKLIEDRELNSRINEVFATLTEVQKRRFIKYYYDKKTYKQIASEENCTYQAIENSIKWIIKKFKNFLIS